MKEAQPLISVIMAVYNGEKTLLAALNSIAAQNYPKIEVILMDDGSIDQTPQIAQQFTFVRYFYQENAGLTAAHNAGLQKAKGEFITFLDHDDQFASNKFNTQMATFQAMPTIEIVRGLVKNIYMSTNNNWSNEGYFNAIEKTKFNTNLGSMIFKRTVFDQLGLFDNRLKICADFDFWHQILFYEIPFFNQETIALYYHLHDDNLILNETQRKREFLQVFKYQIDRHRAKKRRNMLI